MDLKIKNYVVEESKTFTYVVKGLNTETLTYVIQKFLRKGVLFDFRMNAKSTTFSFAVYDLVEFLHMKNMFLALILHC